MHNETHELVSQEQSPGAAESLDAISLEMVKHYLIIDKLSWILATSLSNGMSKSQGVDQIRTFLETKTGLPSPNNSFKEL